MKILFTLLLQLTMLVQNLRAERIVLEDFKSVADPEIRKSLINQAPDDQKMLLATIDRHLRLLETWHGEAGLRLQREALVARARGFGSLLNLNTVRVQVWEFYIGGKFSIDKASGMPVEQRKRESDELEKEETDIQNLHGSIINILFNLAASPSALALNKKAQDVINRLRKLMDRSNSGSIITKNELTVVDKDVDEILKQLNGLPKITIEQAKKEYDSMTEDQVSDGRNIE